MYMLRKEWRRQMQELDHRLGFRELTVVQDGRSAYGAKFKREGGGRVHSRLGSGWPRCPA